jgi:hypothetical protein
MARICLAQWTDEWKSADLQSVLVVGSGEERDLSLNADD